METGDGRIQSKELNIVTNIIKAQWFIHRELDNFLTSSDPIKNFLIVFSIQENLGNRICKSKFRVEFEI